MTWKLAPVLISCVSLFAVLICLGRGERFETDISKPGQVCAAHGILMSTDVVPIFSGYYKMIPEEEKKLFPNASSFIRENTCMSSRGRKARVNFCPECRKAQVKWKADWDARYADAKAKQDAWLAEWKAKQKTAERPSD